MIHTVNNTKKHIKRKAKKERPEPSSRRSDLTLQEPGSGVSFSEVIGNNVQRLWDWVSDQRLLKTTDPFLQIYDSQTLRCVTSVWSVYKGQRADQRGHERMNAFGVHTSVQRAASCVSVVISAFFSVCVKVKTEPDYRAFWRAMGSVCARVCAHTEASLWTQAVVAFLALGAGSWSQISRNLGNVWGGISLALNRRMRDGRVLRGGQKGGKNPFFLSFVAPCRV